MRRSSWTRTDMTNTIGNPYERTCQCQNGWRNVDKVALVRQLLARWHAGPPDEQRHVCVLLNGQPLAAAASLDVLLGQRVRNGGRDALVRNTWQGTSTRLSKEGPRGCRGPPPLTFCGEWSGAEGTAGRRARRAGL